MTPLDDSSRVSLNLLPFGSGACYRVQVHTFVFVRLFSPEQLRTSFTQNTKVETKIERKATQQQSRGLQ